MEFPVRIAVGIIVLSVALGHINQILGWSVLGVCLIVWGIMSPSGYVEED